VGNGRTVLDHEGAPAADGGSVLEHDRRRRPHHGGGRIDGAQLGLERGHIRSGGGVDLVDHQHVGHARDRLAGMMGGHLPRPQGIGDCDMQIGTKKREIVVAAVPDDDVGLGVGQAHDCSVVDPGKDQVAGSQMGLVLLPLLRRAAGSIQIAHGGKPLHAGGREISVGHRVTQHRDSQAPIAHPPRGEPRDRRFAATGPHRRDCEHRARGPQHRSPRPQQREVGAGRQRAGCQVHDVLVRHVAVGEDDLLDAMRAAPGLELLLGNDGNAVGIEGAGERGRITTPGDAGDLCCGEGDHLDGGIVAIDHVEVVEVAAGRSHDHDASPRTRVAALRLLGLVLRAGKGHRISTQGANRARLPIAPQSRSAASGGVNLCLRASATAR
jgi:hypothetical protein